MTCINGQVRGRGRGDAGAMLFYVDELPERQHHPKESDLLFPKVRERCPERAARLDAALTGNQDPLEGHPAPPDFQPVFSKILNMAPAPIALGWRTESRRGKPRPRLNALQQRADIQSA